MTSLLLGLSVFALLPIPIENFPGVRNERPVLIDELRLLSIGIGGIAKTAKSVKTGSHATRS